MRPIRTHRTSALPTQRFSFECACDQGTEDRDEYERHVVRCDRVFPIAREKFAAILKRGEHFAFSVREQREQRRYGQAVIGEVAMIPPERKGRR